MQKNLAILSILILVSCAPDRNTYPAANDGFNGTFQEHYDHVFGTMNAALSDSEEDSKELTLTEGEFDSEDKKSYVTVKHDSSYGNYEHPVSIIMYVERGNDDDFIVLDIANGVTVIGPSVCDGFKRKTEVKKPTKDNPLTVITVECGGEKEYIDLKFTMKIDSLGRIQSIRHIENWAKSKDLLSSKELETDITCKF